MWERANALLHEARGASREGGVEQLYAICRAGIPREWDRAVKDYRVDQGK